MHSNVRYMLRKIDVTVPFGNGAFRIFDPEIHLIHLIINQINSL